MSILSVSNNCLSEFTDSQFRIDLCNEANTSENDLKEIVRVINVAYLKHQYLNRERMRVEELRSHIANPKKKTLLLPFF